MGSGGVPPFEDRLAHGGFFPALVATWQAACFRPTEFFETVGNSEDLGSALVFGVLIGWVSLLVVTLWQMLIPVSLLPGLPGDAALPRLGAGALSLACVAALGWLYPLISIFVAGLIVHLFLLIFGGANRGLIVTLRVVAYAVAPTILAVIPVIGGCIATLWSLVIEIIGLAAAHRTETWRALLAVFGPVILCLCVTLLFGTAFLAALGLAIQQAGTIRP
ncbi:MAG: YIP1 family protein [Armatimonadetes bacterium]|nr:YIP1 family protein [Armatimonadota bacterium]MDW8121386.1 YIP1 family protein [Armatimonadota bacterium]